MIERYTRRPHCVGEQADPADEFLRLACLTYSADDPARWEAAARMLTPAISGSSLHAAAAAGDIDAARAFLGAGGAAPPASAAPAASAAPPGRGDVANALGGPHRWEPLLYLAYSRVPGGDALAVARLLLDAGADPNAGFLWDGLSPPFTALTGAFGRGEGEPPPHRDSLALARLLLEAGADPTDAQTVYNLHWTADDGWLELLLEFGFGSGDGGVWHARGVTPSPRETAEDCLMWAALHGFARRISFLLDAGVDPDGRGTRHPILQGRHALELALAHGHSDAVRVLRAGGATEPKLTVTERIEAAYMAADGTVDAPPPPGLIVRAAESGSVAAVALLLARGADPNAMPAGSSALHEAAFRNHREIVDLLLDAGADPTIRDRRFNADPAGWAAHAGHNALAIYIKGPGPFT